MILSIITINRNNAEGLRKTIESVSVQIFVDFEFIIVDGASTDSSIKTIQQFNSQYLSESKIQHCSWISEPDEGIYQAMNKGISMSSGEYLLFLNSGDTLVNEFVLTNIFKRDLSADFLCGRTNIWNNGKIVFITDTPDTHTFSMYYRNTIPHQGTFIKKKMFDKFGLYREDFKINSDWEFWIRTIILNNASTQRLSEIVANYYLDGFSSNPANKHIVEEEIESVFKNSLLSKFVPDYEMFYHERESMEMFYWVKSKKILYLPLKYIYQLALRLTSKKNHRVKNI